MFAMSNSASNPSPPNSLLKIALEIGPLVLFFINNRNFWVSIIHFYQIPNILFVPAKGTLAIADASIDKATRSSGSKL